MTTVILLIFSRALCAAPAEVAFKNPGFEESAQTHANWEMYPGSAITCAIDTTNPHSGRHCLVFTNMVESTTLENIARFQQWIGVLAGTRYELTVWIRGEDVHPGNFFTDWNNFKIEIPAGTYGWKKLTAPIYFQNHLSWINFGINIQARIGSLAIDDISLRPIGTPFSGKGVRGSYIVPGRVDGDDKSSPVYIRVESFLSTRAILRAELRAGQGIVLSKTAEVRPGENIFDWEWNSGKLTTKDLVFSMAISDSKGKVVASAKQPVEKISTPILLAEIDAIEKRLNGEFAALFAQCRAKGLPVDYPTVTKTTVEQFIPLERQDAKGHEQRRAYFAIRDMNRSLDESISEMRACLANPKLARSARRYRTSKVKINGLSQIGTRVTSDGKVDEGPLFFVGYGHFTQIAKDMPRWPGYGVNLIQHATFGPSAVLTSEHEIDYREIDNLVSVLDDAAKHNVRVDVLISPHYWPGWPAVKWPQLGTGGFLGYPVDMPEAKHVLEKFLRILIPRIKDKPALHSICLSNEPGFGGSHSAQNTKPMWLDYLTRRHGDIAGLNAAYGSSYKSFEEVPMGGEFDDPVCYDWHMFLKNRFAAWHGWLADVIHDMAPDLPVHSKVAAVFTLPYRGLIGNGGDYEMMGRMCDYNGNDCSFYEDREHGFRSTWQLQGVLYDMQRSLNRKPIFNSENHISRDFSTNYIPPEHFRAALWQGAIHGQGSTTIWIWERTTSQPGSWCFYGNAMDRPGCAEAVGTTCLDLNRFADEVTALQNVKAPVAILYSNTAFMRDPDHMRAINLAYEALNFCGVKIDFLSDTTLARGDGTKYRLVILPQTSHLPEDTVRGLLALPPGVRVVSLGAVPTRDVYCRDLPAETITALRSKITTLNLDTTPRQLWPIMLSELAQVECLPGISVVDARTGKPAWGVEWLPAIVKGRTVISMVNLLDTPVEVKVLRRGKEVAVRDLLSVGRDRVRLLKTETPVLAEL